MNVHNILFPIFIVIENQSYSLEQSTVEIIREGCLNQDI